MEENAKKKKKEYIFIYTCIYIYTYTCMCVYKYYAYIYKLNHFIVQLKLSQHYKSTMCVCNTC